MGRILLTVLGLTLAAAASAIEFPEIYPPSPSPSPPPPPKVRVFSTRPAFAEIVSHVGGKDIGSYTLTEGTENPHAVQPNFELKERLKTADLLVVSGMDFEVAWLPPSQVESKNTKIQLGAPGYLDVSTVVVLKGVPVKEDLTRGDTHPAGNPHYMMDPRNGILVARAIAVRLSQLDPAHVEGFKKREEEYETQLKQRIMAWDKALKPFAGKTVVTYHEGWSYFTAWAGLEEVGTIEPKPGHQPTPESVVQLIAKMKARKTRLILAEPYDPVNTVREIARKTGAKVIIARTEPAPSSDPKTYVAAFDGLVSKIIHTPIPAEPKAKQKTKAKEKKKKVSQDRIKPDRPPRPQRPLPESTPEPTQSPKPAPTPSRSPRIGPIDL